MRRASPIWRRRAGLLAAAGLFFTGNLAFFLGYRSTTRSRREALEARRSGLAQEVAAREAEAGKLAAQRERMAGVSEAIEQFYGRRVGSRRETLAPIIGEIHDVLRRVGVSPSQITYATAPISNLPISQMLIGFSFHSDYARFKRLVREFETNRRWIVVREAALTREPEQPGTVQVRLVLATYFSGEEEGKEAAAPAVRRAVS